MKILHVITSLGTGGAEKLMVDLLPRLRVLGNDVELLTFCNRQTEFYKQIETSGIKIHSFGVGIYNPWYVVRLIPYMYKYDVIHTHNTPCQFAAAIAKVLSLSKIKLVTTEHSVNNRRRANKLFYLADKVIYALYESIIAISEQTKISLVSYIGMNDKIRTIYNGIDLSKYGCSSQICHNQNIITMVASLSKAKDQDTVIRAVRYLGTEYKLQLVGDGERRGVLEHLVSRLGLEQQVDFLGIRNDIPELLNQSDVIVLSSHWEGFGIAAVEGMASEKPVVVSDVDGLHEIVNGYGILFKEGDDRQLAAEIKKVVEDKEYAIRVAKLCKAKAVAYDISIMAEKYNELYKTLS